MLSKLAIWYLRKRKASVLIGFEIKGGSFKSLNNKTSLYDNELYDVNYKTVDNFPLCIPGGKFSIERKNKS
jgi:hypothetical protein